MGRWEDEVEVEVEVEEEEEEEEEGRRSVMMRKFDSGTAFLWYF